jgi:hypothetical protein
MSQPAKILSYDTDEYLCSSVNRNTAKWFRCCYNWCTACEKLAFSPSLAWNINDLLGDAKAGVTIDHFQRRITDLNEMYAFNIHLIPYVTQAMEEIGPKSHAWTALSKDGAIRRGTAPAVVMSSDETEVKPSRDRELLW